MGHRLSRPATALPTGQTAFDSHLAQGYSTAVGIARDPYPVKLVASILAVCPATLEAARTSLAARLGALDFCTDLLPFDRTEYYTAEMGTGLVRQIVTLADLVLPSALVAAKGATNAIEQAMAVGGRRIANLDPGYITLAKLVLATTKDHAHRLYLGQGIYGEVTLAYRDGRFRPWPWTYPDYASEEYCRLFGEIRERYRLQLREGPAYSAMSRTSDT